MSHGDRVMHCCSFLSNYLLNRLSSLLCHSSVPKGMQKSTYFLGQIEMDYLNMEGYFVILSNVLFFFFFNLVYQ